MKIIILFLGCCLFPVAAAEKAIGKWVEHPDVKLTNVRQMDGDSFGIEIPREKGAPIIRTYRLYGVDCPESDAKDKRITGRMGDQAKHFGCDPGDIPRHGKQAAEFSEKLLKFGKPRILTRGKLGKKAEKNPGRPQRYFALVEVTAPDGKRRMLHELLLENGHARAFGVPAPWPPDQEDRHGVEKAEAVFKKDLERLESHGKRAGLGAWKRAR